MSTILMTSLSEIESFNPCEVGWKNILKGQNKIEADNELFPLVDCLKSNTISDVCWLLGQRDREIQICVRFAKMCADSVAHLDTKYSKVASVYASAASADAYASATSASADAASFAASASFAAAFADAASAYKIQENKNKEFLIQCINEWPGE